MKQVWWSEEDKAYIVAGEYSVLSAFGKTKDEALKEYEIARKAYLEVEVEDELIAKYFKEAESLYKVQDGAFEFKNV